MDFKEITTEEAVGVITTREPKGLFYHQDNDLWVGIDNTTGNAWTEEFNSKETCLAWLKG